MTDYGTDCSCVPDLDPTFSIRSGPHVVGEAIARRFLTPRGSVSWDLAYGWDTRQLLNDYLQPLQFPQIAAQLEAEARKDERVASASVTLFLGLLPNTLRIKCLLTLASGPFQFELTVSQVAAQQTLVFGR